jgi:predicted nucleotidyltransferase component of viral defense system
LAALRAVLRFGFVFKGGTALKKVHFGSNRFSEDLDFSAVDAPQGGVGILWDVLAR